MKPWVKYTIIRIGLFVVLFAITYPLFLASGIMSLRISGVVAALISAIVSLCVSYLAFGKLRNEMALEIVERRKNPKVNEDEALESDENLEDSALERDRPAEPKAE